MSYRFLSTILGIDANFTGKLGVGTTTPFSKLTVSGAATGEISSEDTTSTGSFVRILGDISSQNLINWQSGTALRFATSDKLYGSFTEAMRITATGKVGIGTTNPQSELDIYAASNPAIILRDSSAIARILPYAGNVYFQTAQAFSSGSTADLYFTGMYGTPVNMLIKATGNVLIGTTTDAGYKLDVNGTGRFSNTLYANSNIVFSGFIQPSSNVGYGVKSANGTVLQEWYDGSTYNYGTLVNSGNINAGNTSSGAQINVYASSYGNNGLFNAYGTDNAIKLQMGALGTNEGFLYTGAGNKLTFYSGGSLSLTLASSGAATLNSLAGSGTRMVVADSSGTLSTQSIPTGTVTGSGTTNYVSKWSSSSSLTNSLLYDDGTNVGIGTTSPVAKLHINNASSAATNFLAGNNSGGTYFGWDSDNTGLISTYATAPIKFGNNYAGSFYETMRIATNGYVGIGTASPSNTLTVISPDYTTVRSQNSWSSNYFTLSNTNGTYSASVFSIINDLAFATSNSATERMRITSAGNVGIGTTIPAGTLHLYRNNSPVVFRLQSASPYSYPGDFTIQTGGYGSNDFIIYDNINSAERFYINNAGNVGIGTTSPIGKLDVDSTGYSIYANNSSGNRIVKLGTQPSSGEPAIQATLSNGTPRYLLINPDGGNVLIGTTTDAGYKLNVNGSAYASTLTDGYITISGAQINRTSGTVELQFNGSDSVRIFGNTAYPITFASGTGVTTVSNLGGSGTRMVVADGSGTLSTQSIPTGTVTGSGTTNYVSKWSSSSSLANSLLYDDGTNVGIGTTSPSAKLTVLSSGFNVSTFDSTYGQMAISFANNGSVFSQIGSGNSVTPTAAYDDLGFGTAGLNKNIVFATGSSFTERMRITSDGNVGIGTSSPAQYISGTETVLQIQNSNAASLNLRSTGANTYVISSITGGALIFYNASVGAEIMRLSATGNVLIGITTDSGYKLDVNGDIRTQTGYIRGANSDADIRLDGTVGSQLRYNGQKVLLNSADAYIYTANTARLYINNAGNVGIGTTNPDRLLVVNGKGRFQNVGITGTPYWNNNSFELQSQGGQTIALEFHRVGYSSATIFSDDGSLAFNTNSGVERMRIVVSTGNVLIGTTFDAGYKLNVNGDGRFNGSVITTSAVTTNQTGGQLAYQGSSVTLLGAWGANSSTRGILSFYLTDSNGTIGNEYARLTDSSYYVVPTTTLNSLSGSGTRMVVADSSGTLSTQAIPGGVVKAYGSWQTNSTQTSPANNFPTPIYYNTVDFNNNVIIDNDSALQYTLIKMQVDGKFNIQFSAQFQNTDSQIQDVTIWLRKNGESTPFDVANSAGLVSIPNSHGGAPGTVIAAWNYFVDASAGDFFQLVWQTTLASRVTMQYYTPGNPPPGAASIILTVNKID